MIFRRSPNVPPLNGYRAYRDAYLCPDFQYRCAYCLTHEFYFLQGNGGEIDHFRPLHAKDHNLTALKHIKRKSPRLNWSWSGGTWGSKDAQQC